MLKEQMDDLSAEIRSAKRERDFVPLVVSLFAFFVGFLNGENIWERQQFGMKEAFLGFALLVLIYGVLSIKIVLLQKELRTLMREYWGQGPKANPEHDI